MKNSTIEIVFIVVAFLIFSLLGFLYYVLHAPWFWERVVTAIVASQKGVEISEVHLTQGALDLPARIRFENLKYKLKLVDASFSFDIHSIEVDAKSFFTGSKPTIFIQSSGVSVDSAAAQIKNASATLTIVLDSKKIKSLEGKVSADQVVASGYVFTNIHAGVTGDDKNVTINDLSADFYQGQIKGKIALEYSPAVTYDMAIDLTQINLNSLKSVNSDVFSKVRGRLNGSVKAQGDLKRNRFIKAMLDVPVDGQIKASLLKPLLEYIPQSVQRKDLELLLKVDGLVALDKATVELTSISEDKLTTIIDLGSKRFNVDSHLTVDLNVEGGLQNLFFYLEKLSK